MFIALYLFARWATATDPQILRILLNAAKFKSRYDPAKRSPELIRGMAAMTKPSQIVKRLPGIRRVERHGQHRRRLDDHRF